ncbi:MAG: transposase [Terrimicrobiaceae bacterium]
MSLSRYIYRTAISSERQLHEHRGLITFQYRSSKTREQKTAKLPALQFLARFLQHVLPKGLRRIRTYGWLSPAAKKKYERLRTLLGELPRHPEISTAKEANPVLCPRCQLPMRLLGTFGRAPPR